MLHTMSLVVVSLLAGNPMAFISPGDERPVGRLCQFFSATDPTVEDSDYGEIEGGPMFFERIGPPVPITLSCTLQIGAAAPTHADTDYLRLDSASGMLGVAVVPTHPISFPSPPENQPVFLCTEVQVENAKWFWDSEELEWTSNPGVGCNLVISQEIAALDITILGEPAVACEKYDLGFARGEVCI